MGKRNSREFSKIQIDEQEMVIFGYLVIKRHMHVG
jgi:hypothetical protein